MTDLADRTTWLSDPLRAPSAAWSAGGHLRAATYYLVVPPAILGAMADTDTRDTGAPEPRLPRPPMAPAKRNLIAAVLVAVAMVGLFFTVRLAVTGDANTSAALPDSVDRLIPASGDEVLTQSEVGIDLAVGYDAYLIVNGNEVRSEADGLVKDLGLGLVKFQPGDGKPVESLIPEKNCVIAMVWPQAEGEDSAEPVSWCFNAA